MTLFGRSQFPAGSREKQLRLANAASDDRLRRMARAFRWSEHDEAVLGWIMAQRGIDLGTALGVFFAGDPGRFNYLPKRDVPVAYRGTARLLDTICQRVNSGFYRPDRGLRLAARAGARRWLEAQHADLALGRRGRWVLDTALVELALAGGASGEGDLKRIALGVVPTSRSERLRFALRRLRCACGGPASDQA